MSIDTLRGMVLVRNEGDGLWADDERWSVERVLQIGSLADSASAYFTSILVSTAHGEGGHLFVLDQALGNVREFDEAGRFVRRFGRRGEGPGEFMAAKGVAVDLEGRVWVSDARGSRYTVFSENGEVEGTYRRPVRYDLSRQQELILRPDGSILDISSRASSHGDVVLIRTYPESESSDTLYSAPVPVRISAEYPPGPIGPFMRRVSMHYLQGVAWTVGPDDSFWVAWGGGAQLVNMGPAGDTIRVIEVEHRPRPLTEDEEDLVAAAVRESRWSRDDLNIVPSVVKFLRVTEDGHLLVFVASDPIDFEASVDNASVMEVYDPEGRFLGAVDLGFAIPRTGIPSVRGDTILAPIIGELDATFVVKAVIRRGR